MDMLANISMGLQTALTVENLSYCLLGVTLGTLIGVLPGIGSLAGLSMLLPLSFYLPSTAAIVMLAGIYYGSQYGGSVASILLNLPGSPSSAIACLDGYPMTQQGRGGIALFMTTAGSFVGATVGILLLMAVGPLLATFGLAFGAAEYASMMVLALLASATIAQGSPLKGLAVVILGVLLGCVGSDPSTGMQRFTFGITTLIDGIPMVALAMGLFGLTEVISQLAQGGPKDVLKKVPLRSMIPTKDDVARSSGAIARGAALGSVMGALPGPGVTLSAIMAYVLEKKRSKHPERFGNGAIEGVTAPETANNAAAQTAFIPTLTLGVPADATMAILVGALMIHGIPPGPMLVEQHPDLFWGLIMSFWIGNIMLVILNIPLIGIWVKMVQIPFPLLFPGILLALCMGVYSVSSNPQDILAVAIFGAVGYFMKKLQFEPAPLLIGFILGPMVEQNVRRALTISRGDPMIFVDRPISAVLLLACVVLIARPVYAAVRRSLVAA